MRQLLFISAVLLATACSDTGITPAETAPKAISEPLFATLYSNVRDARRIVIHDEASWAALWAEMVSSGSMPTTPPRVDFSKEDVVVAAMGERRFAGYEITITGVEQDAGHLRVDVASKTPSPTCDHSEVITTPLHAVRVSKTSEPISFNETTVVLSCN